MPQSTSSSSDLHTQYQSDKPINTIEDLAISNMTSYQPLAIRSFTPFTSKTLDTISPALKAESFTGAFLKNTLGGIEWNPGYYWIPPTSDSIIPGRAYYLVNAAIDPFVPKVPGEHGAKLVPFFNEGEDEHGDCPDEEALIKTPLFISVNGNTATNSEEIKYIYVGDYTQSRYSDKLDYDRMVEIVPHEVKM